MSINSNNDFEIVVKRGNPLKTKLFIDTGVDGEPYRYNFKEKDKVVFYIMPVNCPFEQAIFLKTFTHDNLNNYGDVEIEITKDEILSIPFNAYEYMIKVFQYVGQDENNEELYKVNTVTNGYKFTILHH